jgi:tRNA A-37 threonylcarbamoyl transferase component Bud32
MDTLHVIYANKKEENTRTTSMVFDKTITTPTPSGGESLTEQFNEAYDEEARREDEEFVKNLKRYHRRRFSDEW